MHFEYPFILISSIPFLILWWIFLREKTGYMFPNSLMKQHSRIDGKMWTPWILRGSMIFLIFFIISIPTYTYIQKKPIISDKSITFVLDISKSMLADDIAPNRLEKAKEVLISFLEHESTNQFGLIIFAGKPFILSPLTYDKNGIINVVKNISTDTIKQQLPGLSGTNIGDALLNAEMLHKNSQGDNIIILMTDGRANLGINPITSAKYLGEHGTIVYTIGIGESSGGILSYLDNDGNRQYFYDENGEKLRADIDKDTLREIAMMTHGKFFEAYNPNIFEEIFDTVRSDIIEPIEFREEKTPIPITPSATILLFSFWIIHSFLLIRIRKI